MPASAALSGTRGLPPFVFGVWGGSSGRMACHNSSGISPLSVVVIVPLLGGRPALAPSPRPVVVYRRSRIRRSSLCRSCRTSAGRWNAAKCPASGMSVQLTTL